MREPTATSGTAETQRSVSRTPLRALDFWAQSSLVSRCVLRRIVTSAGGGRGVKFLCDRCKTRYSIGDDRVRGKILKIRCKNCANVITVREGMDATRRRRRRAAQRPPDHGRPGASPASPAAERPRRRVREPARQAAAGARGGVVRLDRRRPVRSVLARRGAALGREQAVRRRPPLLERRLRRLAARRQGQPLPRPAKDAPRASGAATMPAADSQARGRAQAAVRRDDGVAREGASRRQRCRRTSRSQRAPSPTTQRPRAEHAIRCRGSEPHRARDPETALGGRSPRWRAAFKQRRRRVDASR